MMADGILVLEGKHMISTMLYLLSNDGCIKTDIYRGVSNNPRMPEKLNLLEDAGLIRQESYPENRSVRIFLTDMGREVGNGLMSISGLMG